MGFSTLLDILGSTIIGALLFLILLRLNDAAVENTYRFGGEVISQQNLVEIVNLIEYDFRKMGYCADWTQIPDPTKSIILATRDSISFLTDFVTPGSTFGDGIVDTMHYYVGPASELISTPNPRDKFLYRIENSEAPVGVNLGVTSFRFRYFDDFGYILPTPVANPGAIASIQIDLIVENVYGMTSKLDESDNDQYSSVYWRQIRLASRNLRRR